MTEFCYKGVNLFLEELKTVTMILYSNTRTVQIAEFSEISHFFNQHHSSLVRHVKATSRKSSEIQAQSITKPKLIRSENLYEYWFLAALRHHESKISGGSIVLKFEI